MDTGTLTLTHGMITDWSDISFGTNRSDTNAYEVYTQSIQKANGISNIVSNVFPIVTPFSDVAEYSMRGVGNAKDVLFKFPKAVISSAADAKQWLINNSVQLLYELAIPQTIQLAPIQVYLLYGYNTLFGDCGDISLTYDASGIIHIAEAKLDTETLKTIAAASSDFADFKARIAAL